MLGTQFGVLPRNSPRAIEQNHNTSGDARHTVCTRTIGTCQTLHRYANHLGGERKEHCYRETGGTAEYGANVTSSVRQVEISV
jgi:hypothetical protein